MEDAPNQPESVAAEHGENAPRWFRPIALLTAGVLLLLQIVYMNRPDALTAITVFPVWIWTAAVSVPVLVMFLFASRRYGYLLILPVVVTLLLADTPLSLIRVLYQPAPPVVRAEKDDTIRIITLNCLHQQQAVADLKRFEPDIVLVQEYRRIDVEQVRRELFGEASFLIRNHDVAIFSRFPLTEHPMPRDLYRTCLAGRAEIGEMSLLLVPLHLNSPPPRLDLWKAESWRSYTKNRNRQREQLQLIFESLPKVTPKDAVVLGGDFNAPPGDAIFELLPPFMQDAFHEVGVGWGRTYANDLPVIRIDQLWSTPVVTPLRCMAVDSNGSDHRAVIVDYELRF
ncbi:endonuclease/exonuclease/phosphatase family protein [Rubinisphaera margarita]|uniref:endonuclease/exonuclease/phosphatase family protein n=1 Tax=Rubinisphaera margarita TaxID=2909586 RepID=UPI001EE9075F|nr:endonuclease/exonuclease/phosphatase family protein [Rubinisphaera margarita]MCG6157603.1 endonuclease/exonuclease/phosphatase family protein [Rubinisphaera margarita]